MIRATLLSILLLASGPGGAADKVDPWTSRPELRLLAEIAESAILDFGEWSDQYKESARTPAEADWTVNRMVEQIFVRVLAALGEAPNPGLQRKCLILLGETLPPEFDSIWRMVLLEMDSNLDKSVSREVGKELKAKGLPSLVERATAKE